MGNYASCALLGPNAKHGRAGSAKVIIPGGEIRTIYEPITAAELMLESPDSVIVNSKSLQMGRRFSAMSADEELEMGNVYVVFSKQRLNSVVNAADMGALFLAAKRSSKVKRAPDHQLLISSDDQTSEELFSPEVKHRLTMCRSKKPLFETIVE